MAARDRVSTDGRAERVEAPTPDPVVIHVDDGDGEPGPTPSGADEPPPPAERILSNLTPMRLRIRAVDGRELQLAALGRRTFVADELATWPLGEVESRGLVRQDDPPVDRSVDWLPALPFWGLILTFVAWIVSRGTSEDGVQSEPLLDWWWVWGGGLAVTVVVTSLAAAIALRGVGIAIRALTQGMSLTGVLVVGFGVPVLATIAVSDTTDGTARDELLAVGVRVVFVGLAATLPALLYFLFDRQRLATLRERFERQVFRLDPDLATVHDLDAKYGSLMEEAFGEQTELRARLHTGTRWPIMLATSLVTVGWLVALPPIGLGDPDLDPTDLASMVEPAEALVAFGFLGAYFFTLHTVLRRFVRADLRPKTYGSITVRILVVFVLAWLMDVVWEPGPVALVSVFVLGVVPETWVLFIQEFLRSSIADRLAAHLREKHPLDRLDGIDLYDLARLRDEGVTNVESLAHHDLVDLLLETRIPAARLVDWVDQSVLYLHVADDTEAQPWLAHLRSRGVRTATDLLAVVHAPGASSARRARLVPETGDEASALDRIDILVTALEDDEWVDQLLHWRRSNSVEMLTIGLDGRGAIIESRRRRLGDTAGDAPSDAPRTDSALSFLS